MATVSSLIPALVTLKSALGPETVGPEKLESNYKAALSAIENRGYDEADKKAVLQMIKQLMGQK